MGQVCFASEENEARIQELESLLKDQELEKDALKKKLESEKERQRQVKASKRDNNDNNAAETIEKLTNEKKQVFKTMLKERKQVSKLEDEIENYKVQIDDMEQKMKDLKREKEKARKKAEEAEKKRKKEEARKKAAAAAAASGNSSDSGAGKKQFQLGSVLDGIKIPTMVDIPNFNGSNNTKPDPPFRVKSEENSKLKPRYGKAADSDAGGITSEDDYGGTTTEMSDSDDDVLEQKTTIILDENYDEQTEATHVWKWLHGQKIDPKNKQAVKQLKHQLASLLTSRSEGYRQKLVQAYRDQYGKNMEKEIKSIITKGHAMEIIHGLLMTRAEFDAAIISECVSNWDIEPVADIICCRSIKQLHELHDAFKKKQKLDLKKQLQALAQKDKKKTLVKVIGSILDKDRKEKAQVNENSVNQDLNFVLTTKNFKGDSKEKLVLIFTANSVQYIKVLNDQFRLKNKDSLNVFIDKKLGPKSTAGYFCKTRILYALNAPDYYAQKIKKLGSQYKKNQKKISDIFIQRMETDLDAIQRVWAHKKYGDGKDLKQWIVAKSSGSKSGHFLCEMLRNCGRYAEFNKTNEVQAGGNSKFAKMML